MIDPLLLQLADSAFPSGAFAHSAGLEALRQLGHLAGEAALRLRLRELVWHAAHGAGPFVNDAHRAAREADASPTPGGRDALAVIDRDADAFLTSHVANRASRAQGQAFALAAHAAFGDLVAAARALPCGHAAVALGAVTGALGVPVDDARVLMISGALRAATSAAVRLGVVGPLRAQHLLAALRDEVAAAAHATAGLGRDDACAIAPVLDAAQGVQDQLYSRLFQS